MAQQHLPKRRNSAAQPGKWWCHGVLPASAGQRKAQEKPGATLQKFLLELSQVAGNGNLLFIFAKTTTSATSTADSAVGTTLTDMPRHGKYYSV
mmetsp:Transcript_5937/g.12837  ORF Transcript_5937/g.12837 Transcript_5937/m.12837 type:complete len:94 (+) Transcript_5937:159-440(+)